jgi:7-cyano-7-deazaguanine synthase
MSQSPRAVVLLSGGLDSATVLAIARAEGFDCTALTFDYGQRHRAELAASRRVARGLGAADHRVVSIDLRGFGGSALTADIPVPKGRSPREIGAGIPVTYVPARNTIFLAFALACAEVIDARDIFIGVNAIDCSGYPDCRPEFVEAFERLASVATRAGAQGARFHVRAPLMNLSKGEIIRRGIALGVDYALTLSCYDPDAAGVPCGACDACLLRAAGFREARAVDPAAAPRTAR